MRNFPAWIPNLNSWMSAILLAAIVSIATTLGLELVRLLQSLFLFLFFLLQLFGPIFNFLLRILSLLPDFIQQFIFWFLQITFAAFSALVTFLTTISAPLLLLVPIVVIAFAHHYMNLFLDRFFPDIPLSEMEKVSGFFPSILSWWEGFYGLLVIIVALLIGDIALSLFPFLAFNSNIPNIEAAASSGRLFVWYLIGLLLFTQPLYTPIARLFVWIVAAAYLYQFEATIRQHLISVGSQLESVNRNER